MESARPPSRRQRTRRSRLGRAILVLLRLAVTLGLAADGEWVGVAALLVVSAAMLATPVPRGLASRGNLAAGLVLASLGFGTLLEGFDALGEADYSVWRALVLGTAWGVLMFLFLTVAARMKKRWSGS